MSRRDTLLAVPAARVKELEAEGSAFYRQIKAARARVAEERKLQRQSERVRPPAPSAERIEQLCRTGVPGYDPWRDAGERYVFNAELAREEIQWAHDRLTHVKGPLAGEAFRLEDWQVAIWGNLFGWVDRETYFRRYRTCNIFVPEKNGKTPFAAGIALRVYFGDKEPGSETYCVSWTVPQAMLVREWAAGMIENDEELCGSADITAHAIYRIGDDGRERNAWFKTIASGEKGLHGPNVHCAVVDELHTFEQEGSIGVLKSKTAARRQPLVVQISTAGWDRESICYREWQYSRHVRDGDEGWREPTHLPAIWETANSADWRDPAVWRAVNPNYGVSFNHEAMELAYKDVVRDPSKENLFRQLKLNQWTEQAVRYLPMDAWDRCPKEPIDLERLEGEIIYLGFDGALTEDLTALSAIIPHDGGYILKSWAWIPEVEARERQKRDKVPYLEWAKKGIIELTPGRTTDWRFVERKLEWLAERYQVPKIVYDPAKATQWALQVSDRLGIEFSELPQTAAKLNEATETFKRLVLEARIHHGGDPCLRWQAGNCELKKRSDDLCQLGKPARNLRIDGMVAGVMALWLALAEEGVGLYQEPIIVSAPNSWDQSLELLDDD